MTERRLTAHGELLDAARISLGYSQREAARRAGISEGRWRQILTGIQRQGGVSIPVNPKPATLAAMARAVEADVTSVLSAAGLSEADVPPPGQAEREADALAELRRQMSAMSERIAELDEEVRRLRGSAG